MGGVGEYRKGCGLWFYIGWLRRLTLKTAGVYSAPSMCYDIIPCRCVMVMLTEHTLCFRLSSKPFALMSSGIILTEAVDLIVLVVWRRKVRSRKVPHRLWRCWN